MGQKMEVVGIGGRQIDCLTGIPRQWKSISSEELNQFVCLAVCTLVTDRWPFYFLILNGKAGNNQYSR